jgi:signal transduction histidine kinase
VAESARAAYGPAVGKRLAGRWVSWLPAWAADVGLAVAVGVAAVAYTAAYGEGGPQFRPRDALAYALTVVAAAALVGRRRWPVAVFAVTLAATLAYVGRNYSTGGISLALLVALSTLAAEGNHRRTAVAAAIMLGSFVLVRALWVYQGWNYRRTLISPGMVIGGCIAAVFLGLAVSSRRAYIAAMEDRAQRAERSREEEARRRVDAERMRIAREFHDIVGHSIATINVLAGVAVHVMDKRPQQAAEALRTIKATSQQALREVRAGLGVLQERDEEEPRAPTPGLDQLDLLVAITTKAGVSTEVHASGEPRRLPAPVDLAAYRIVQESLTNVIRHAGADAASVTLVYEDCRVIVEVENRGGAGPDGAADDDDTAGSGHGLVGMRERALALGGEFEAGPRDGGGFRVRASLPLGAES